MRPGKGARSSPGDERLPDRLLRRPSRSPRRGLLAQALPKNPDFTVHGGDIQYDDSKLETWASWFQDALSAGSEQATWLEAQLADASKQPGYRLSIVDFHKPWVTCGDKGDAPDLRAHFEPVFARYGVVLVIQAHMHGYERFEFGALTCLTAAGGGGLLGDPDENVARTYCDKRVASGRHHSAVILDVAPGKLSGAVIDTTGTVRDTFTKLVP